ncbi:MAG: hypothetical protein HOK21_18145 [Rhodospirillaceae bacterium]|jgi:altronate dehydratase|nr:hypothetical protein [Rhodospirillaceae bacterium]MBT4043574.1 hypothetical protein [Rhodospirillaceae bacterium]MBT5079986.1 hypothetical protein [Rhodospirillaceae bacterium]MBT5526008.1 hypothetical protein [Rhodospirillaceae bacterium]MBT5881797.1 hypothetical protein [Rhodospirillaceae bacterium]
MTLDDLGQALYDLVLAVAQGTETCSEALGHQEFCIQVQAVRTYQPRMPAYLYKFT